MRDPSSVPTNDCGGLPLPVLDIDGAASASARRQDLAAARPSPSPSPSLAGGTVDVNGIRGASGDSAVGVGGVGVGVGVPVAEAGVEHTVGGNGVNGVSGVNSGNGGVAAVNVNGGGGGMSVSMSPSLQRRARVSGSWPPRPDSFSFHTVIKALTTAGMWEDAVEMLEEMAEERWVAPWRCCWWLLTVLLTVPMLLTVPLLFRRLRCRLSTIYFVFLSGAILTPPILSSTGPVQFVCVQCVCMILSLMATTHRSASGLFFAVRDVTRRTRLTELVHTAVVASQLEGVHSSRSHEMASSTLHSTAFTGDAEGSV